MSKGSSGMEVILASLEVSSLINTTGDCSSEHDNTLTLSLLCSFSFCLHKWKDWFPINLTIKDLLVFVLS